MQHKKPWCEVQSNIPWPDGNISYNTDGQINIFKTFDLGPSPSYF